MAIALLKLLMILTFVSNVALADLDKQLAAIKTELDLRQFSYFKATFGGVNLTVAQKTTLLFDHVIDNRGEAYDASTGVFTAPCPGLYMFTVNMFPRGDTDPNYDLHLNGERMLRGKSYGREYISGFVFPLSLNVSDNVSVFNEYAAFTVWGLDHTFFSGWLVEAY